jgi:hypothetical protein
MDAWKEMQVNSDKAGDPPYVPPEVEDIGTLEEITGSGAASGPREGVNNKT